MKEGLLLFSDVVQAARMRWECSACMSGRERGLCVNTLQQNVNHINNYYLIFFFYSDHCSHASSVGVHKVSYQSVGASCYLIQAVWISLAGELTYHEAMQEAPYQSCALCFAQCPDIVLVITCEQVTYKHPVLVCHLKTAMFFLKMADRKGSCGLTQVHKGMLYLANSQRCVRMQ